MAQPIPLSALCPPSPPHHPWVTLAPAVSQSGIFLPRQPAFWLQWGPCWLLTRPRLTVPLTPAGQRGAHDGEDEDGDPAGPGAAVRLGLGPAGEGLPKPQQVLPDPGCGVHKVEVALERGGWGQRSPRPASWLSRLSGLSGDRGLSQPSRRSDPPSSPQKREMPRSLHHGVPVQPLLLRGEGRFRLQDQCPGPPAAGRVWGARASASSLPLYLGEGSGHSRRRLSSVHIFVGRLGAGHWLPCPPHSPSKCSSSHHSVGEDMRLSAEASPLARKGQGQDPWGHLHHHVPTLHQPPSGPARGWSCGVSQAAARAVCTPRLLSPGGSLLPGTCLLSDA